MQVNLANRITIGRLLIPIVFLPILMADFQYAKLIALCLFLVGTLSDWLDGYIARKYNMTSDFGRLMDPLADKILVAAALISFIALVPSIVRVWMVVIIIARDFLITGLRLLALSNNYVLSADTIGKHKTAWQMAAIISVLVFLAYRDMTGYMPEAVNSFVASWMPVLLSILFYSVTGLTLVSGIFYLWRYRDIYYHHV